INFTAWNNSWTNNSLNYTYELNISVSDDEGLINWTLFNLTIFTRNDPPEFNFTNTTARANTTFYENLSSETADEENDKPFFFNISFVDCKKENESDTNCSIFTINHTTGIINFTVLEKDIGNYTINVSVRDSGDFTQPYNATSWKLINFTILPLNRPPTIEITDYYMIYNNTPYVGTKGMETPMKENYTIHFSISVNDPDGNSLECRWYKDGSEYFHRDNCQYRAYEEYIPSFEDSGRHLFRVEATDGEFTSYDEINVTINNTNRPPQMVYPIQNQTWNMNTENRNIMLTYNFKDPDNENNVTNDDNNLTFYCSEPSHITVLINNQPCPVTISSNGSAVVTLTPQTDWYGTDYIVFNVSDGEFNASSNNVTLNVTYTETPTQTITQYLPSGGGFAVSQTGARIASLAVSVSNVQPIKPYSTSHATITLENTGDVELTNINLKAELNETDIIPRLNITHIDKMAIKQRINLDLKIISYNLTKSSYEIKITAAISQPKFNSSTLLYIKSIFNETKLEKKIRFAKDLFQDNPECMELTELIVQAEKELGRNNIEKARKLTDMALENCRDIIRYMNATRFQKVTPEVEKPNMSEIIIALLIISLISILAYMMLEKRAEAKSR
ncbi:MAG: hypothetical protein J7K72_02345, partial [Candidatus Aenigmarchaeota archaeon]|nr:hypothetical protein [Candidatus Aenigmarchaeota archaeon]